MSLTKNALDSVGETVKNSAGIKHIRLKPVCTRFRLSLGMQRGGGYSMAHGGDSLETFQMANRCNQCLLHAGVSTEGVEASPKVLATLGFRAPAQLRAEESDRYRDAVP